MSAPHLSRLRVQKYCCKTYSPNVLPTFLQLFFTFPDCQYVMNTLFPRSLGLTQKNQKLKATLRRLQILFAPLEICFTPSPLGRSSLPFISSLPFLFHLSKFSIFNSPFSILKKPAYFCQFAPAFHQNTPAFCPFMPTFLKQLNGNRIWSSLDLLSIPVYFGWYSSITYLLLP